MLSDSNVLVSRSPVVEGDVTLVENAEGSSLVIVTSRLVSGLSVRIEVESRGKIVILVEKLLKGSAVMVMGSSVDIRVDSSKIVGVSASDALIMVDDSGVVRSELIEYVE